MDMAYLHVVINHLPIMGVPLGIALLLLGGVARSGAIQRAALLAFALLGAATVPVFLTGEAGEDFIERVPGISEDALDSHEDFAPVALGAMLALGALALAGFALAGGWRALRDGGAPLPLAIAGTTLLAAVVAAAAVAWMGKLGGRIRHTEFAAPVACETGAECEDEDGGRKRRRGRDH